MEAIEESTGEVQELRCGGAYRGRSVQSSSGRLTGGHFLKTVRKPQGQSAYEYSRGG